MKQIIKIKTKAKSYNIIIENKSILANIIKEAKQDKKIFIIIDNKVKYLIEDLPEIKNINIIKTNSGEKIKSINYFSEISNRLLKLKIDRSSTIIAIGGGTIGDLSGFIASTILRGVRFILIPTTLLAQVDSSIGGKNGINSSFGKNLIGTFLQPDLVIVDPSALLTLSKREVRSGYSEILKHALIKDIIFYRWLSANYKNVINLDNKFITKAIVTSIKIKAFFVQNDEKEKLVNDSSRAMLNFGHTFGHALELMNQYNGKLSHGEAVSIGMALAAKVSNKLNLIKVEEYEHLILHLKKVKLPYFDKRIKDDLLYKLMSSDKKNSNNKINLVLLKQIGKGHFKRGLNREEIKKLLN
jgi:shikimate kinase/3-dehydroquinate synthase